MPLSDEEYTKKKNKRKLIRYAVQILILIVLGYFVLTSLYTFSDYEPYQDNPQTSYNGDKGFVAISYFGVARHGDQTLISRDLLYEHLSALKKSGYVTITQQEDRKSVV